MSDSTRTLGRRDMMRAGVGAAAAAAVAQPASAQEDPYGDWFADTDNYNGTVDLSGQETVTVAVGAGDQGILFEPPAIQVDPGTTVVWEWTGEGGSHNVIEENGVFESELVDEAGHTFEHTFTEDNDGEIFRYFCQPHQSLGMVGAVAVGDVVEETIAPEGADESTEAPADDGSENASAEDDSAEPASVDGAEESANESAPAGTTGSLSTNGFLAVFGGILGTALLSPVIFALILKFVYEDEIPAQTPEHRP